MRVLVTGGAGFIGSHLVRRLVSDGADVIVLDNLSSGSADGLPDAAEVVVHDITAEDTTDVIHRLRPTHVVHAAAQVRVAASMADPAGDRAVNLAGTRRVVAGAEAAGATRLVFMSSGGAVYGDTAGATEDSVPAPMSYYGVHKLAAEGYVRIGSPSHAIARPANVYGPGQQADLEGGVVAIFCRAAAAGEPVTIHGDGEQVRDFVHVRDVVDALVAMLTSPESGTWNVATGVETSINQLVDAVGTAFDRPLSVTSGPRRIGDVRSSTLRIEQIGRDLGWRPAIDLATGLRELAANRS